MHQSGSLDGGITPFFVTWCNYRCRFCVRKALWRWFYPRSRKRNHFQTLATGVPKLKTLLGTQRVKAQIYNCVNVYDYDASNFLVCVWQSKSSSISGGCEGFARKMKPSSALEYPGIFLLDLVSSEMSNVVPSLVDLECDVGELCGCGWRGIWLPNGTRPRIDPYIWLGWGLQSTCWRRPKPLLMASVNLVMFAIKPCIFFCARPPKLPFARHVSFSGSGFPGLMTGAALRGWLYFLIFRVCNS